MPTAANFFSQMTAILGYSPPAGFNFQTYIQAGNGTLTIANSGAGALYFPNGTPSVAAYKGVILMFWVVVAATSYGVTVSTSV
jgi:hypothetical protein